MSDAGNAGLPGEPSFPLPDHLPADHLPEISLPEYMRQLAQGVEIPSAAARSHHEIAATLREGAERIEDQDRTIAQLREHVSRQARELRKH